MTLTDFERKVIGEFTEENGAPAGFVAQFLGISTAKVTNIAKKLQAEGLLEDTGYAMKFNRRTGKWDWIDKPKTEGGMVSKPGASTVWRATLAGHAAVEHEPSPHVEWKSGNETQEDAMATRRTPRGAARYRITIKSWDRHYGDGHVVFKHNFETKRSEEVDAKAIEILEKAMADNKPQGRSAQAWAERVSHDGYPTTLVSYDGSSGAWVVKTPRLASVSEAHARRPRGGAKAAGEQYARDQLEGDYFREWIYEQMLEASQMDPSEVLPLETEDDARKVARAMLKQLEWDTKRELNQSREFFEGFDAYLRDSSTVDWVADEVFNIHHEIRGTDPRQLPLPGVRESGRRATRWTDWMILESVERGHGLTGPARDRAIVLGTLGYIDTKGTWKLTSKGRRALERRLERVDGASESRQRTVADFNTLDDLIEHARQEGATHVLKGRKSWGDPNETYLYFPTGDHIRPYAEARVWQEGGYWHTEARGERALIVAPPQNAEPIRGRR